MEKKLIYRDDRMIENYVWGYKEGIKDLQAIIDNLTKQGMTLSDNVLNDLYGGGIETKDAILCQINEEIAKVKFQASKDEIKKQLEPLPYKVDEAVDKVRKAINVSRGVFTIHMEFDNIIVKDLKVSTVPNLEEIITEQFSTYTDDEITAKAYEWALKLEKELNEYHTFLREQGDWLKPVGDKNLYAHAGNAVIGIDAEGKASIQPVSFQILFSKRRKPQ